MKLGIVGTGMIVRMIGPNLASWGILRYYDEDGTMHQERVETVRSTYSGFYEALYETLVNGAPQLVKPEETIAQLRILEEATKDLK